MKKLISRVLVTVVAASMIATLGVAETKKADHAKAGMASACPVCKMSLSKKKDKMHTTAVRLKKGGPVMYCCANCKMPASVLVKGHHGHKAHAKPAVTKG